MEQASHNHFSIDITALQWLESKGARFCKVLRGDKKPIEKSWQNKPYTLEEIIPHIKSAGNVGLICGSHSGNIGMLDIDENFSGFLAEFPALANAPTITRDGADKGKLLVRVNGEMPGGKKWRRNLADEPPFMEWLSDGNQGVIPPSIHPSGAPYQLINADHEIQVLTPEELNAVCMLWGDAGLLDFDDDEPELPANLEKPARREYPNPDGLRELVIEAWNPLQVFQHFGRANKTRLEGDWLRLFGNGGLFVHKDMQGWNLVGVDGIGGGSFEAWWYCTHGNCNVPKDRRFYDLLLEMAEAAGIEIPKRASQERRKAPNVAIAHFSNFDYSALPFEDAQDDTRTKTRWSVAELYATEFPAPEWVAENLIPVGLSILAGRPKLGKSWLALQLAHSKATGGIFLGQRVKQGEVLYIALEDSPRRLQDRAKKQGIPQGAPIQFVTGWKPLTDEGRNDLVIEVASERYSLIIIDTLSRSIGRADQLDLTEMTNLIGSLQSIAQKGNIAILLIDHHRKNSGFESNPIDDLMGSTGKSATADCLIGLYREQGKHQATLRITGRDFEDREIALEWDSNLYCWQYAGEAGEVRDYTLKSEIIDAISELKGMAETSSTTNIAAHIGANKGNVSRALADLVSRNIVRRGEKIGRERPYELIDEIQQQQ